VLTFPILPDDFASEFGVHVENDDYSSALSTLLKDDLWREKGQRGHEYVIENYELDKVLDRHLNEYKRLLSR